MKSPLRRRARKVLGMTSGLRRRLLVMLIAPLVLLALLNAWFDYRSADNVAAQQDERGGEEEPADEGARPHSPRPDAAATTSACDRAG